MASNNKSSDIYIYNLPYEQHKDLCRILDRDNKWEELGGRYMNFDMMTIQDLRRDDQRGTSPTDQLLTRWGQQNHTVVQLFVLLSKMHHYQAMLVLKPLVDSKYHPLIYEGEENISRFIGRGSNKGKPTNPESFGQKQGANGSGSEAAQTQIGADGTPHNESSTPLPDKNMNVGSENLNITGAMRYTTRDKILFPPEQPERKIVNVPMNAVSDDRNDTATSDAGAVAAANPAALRSPLPAAQDMAVRLPAENKENNNPAPNSQRKMSNASDVSSVAESCLTIPQISYKELKQATNDWDKSTILGKGGFGTVFKGNWKNTLVAIKRIDQRGAESAESYQAQMEQSLRELRILNACRHDNILPLYGFSVGGVEPCLVYQFMPNGSLEDRLLCRQGTKPLTWVQRHNIAEGTARGLQFLHNNEKPFIHGDIKSANILLDNNFEPRIGDFGLAREGPQSHYTHMKVSRVHGTRPYLPDEFLRAKQMSTKVDTFSFGIVLFELATGQRAYDDVRQNKLLKEHVEICQKEHLGTLCDTKAGTSDQETFMHLITLGQRCVSQRARDRPEMEEVLKQLEHIASFRRIVDQTQHLVRKNSFNPSNPYELKVMQDYLSHQRKLSSPALPCSGLPPTTSPLPFRVPLSVSPEPISHINMIQVGMNFGYGPPLYQPPHHAQVSPSGHPAVQLNNLYLDANFGQRLSVPNEETNNSSAPSTEEQLFHQIQVTPTEGKGNANYNNIPQCVSGMSAASVSNSNSHHRTVSPTSLHSRSLPHPPLRVSPALQLAMPANITSILPQDTASPHYDPAVPTVDKAHSPQPIIAVSPPSVPLSLNVSFPNSTESLLPITIRDRVTSSAKLFSHPQDSEEEGAAMKPTTPSCDTSNGLPLISELGLKDVTQNDCKHETIAQNNNTALNYFKHETSSQNNDAAPNNCKHAITAKDKPLCI